MESEWTFLPGESPSAIKKHPDSTPSVEHFTDDPFLLHHIEETDLQTEFDLDGIDFIVPDDLGARSKAFPPSEFPQNTPALMAKDTRANFQSPILPSQNEKSYNEEHFIQKQRQNTHKTHMQLHLQLQLQLHPLHVRPDAVFTPLVSPAVTPMDLQVNTNKQPYSAVQTSFQPLTLPALNAQTGGNTSASSSSDRRRSLSTFGADDYAGSQAKRRTPHLTPNLAAHLSKLKRSPLFRKAPQQFDALPDSSYDAARSAETTPMLPPQGKRIVIDSSSGNNTPAAAAAAHSGSGSGSAPGPATLMGFTMNRLAELQSARLLSLSPSLQPHGSGIKPRKVRRDSNSLQRSTGRNLKMESSLSESSPLLEAQNGEYSRREKPPTKKASHKLAEQGRRNRMNQAVYELAKLIPSLYHDQVSIPSKATTVELAASYIKDLLEELDSTKYGDLHKEL